MQKLVLKKKKKSKQKQKLSLKQRLAQTSVQKQLQILELREWLVIIGFTLGAAALRVPMQAIPSAEPITFFALLSGWLFGKRKGFLTGVGALYVSNFLVFGGQGIWTIFQAIGFGIAGFLGGFLGKKAKVWQIIGISIIATIIFEITINIGSLFMFPFGFLTLFLTALPFGIIHLISNSAFALLIPQTKAFIEKKGEFDQKEVCKKLLDRFKNIKQITAVKK
jgi:hypothetical protein